MEGYVETLLKEVALQLEIGDEDALLDACVQLIASTDVGGIDIEHELPGEAEVVLPDEVEEGTVELACALDIGTFVGLVACVDSQNGVPPGVDVRTVAESGVEVIVIAHVVWTLFTHLRIVGLW